MADRIDVMISSTALDLPDHRKQVIEAILRMSMHPIAMEHLSAMSADAIDASLALVDEAEIYVGIFAHRYGYIPDSPKNPDKLSITELEYRRAVERDIPRLIFIMGDDHPITSKDLETNPDGAAKLLALKNELKTSYVASFFNSPDQLREQVISALANYRQKDPGGAMHYISDIPRPPEAYIAHPYTLLQTTQLAGRQKELNLLTDWVVKPHSDVYGARILNIVAIGGMGKSALTWKWFNDIAPHEMKPMAGALWWSFYESDAHWENFIIRALAYVAGRPREDIEQNTNPVERENLLLKILNEKPFLLVLDGLERILVAYARMDAAHIIDDDLDDKTSNWVANAMGLPKEAAQSFVNRPLLRKTADPRAGNFLRKLASVKHSRVLVSTRLYPADLQSVTGGTIPGSFAYFLLGLGDDDAVDLWRALGVSGSRDTLLPMFHRFDNYPLLIRALAGEVARFRRAPGDFDAWQKSNADFDPFKVELVNVKSHVLYHALRGLDEREMKVLHTVAAFRMPASYDTIAALLVGENAMYQTEIDLDITLNELEDRGLLGWDRRANRYDLHPVVRGVVWDRLDDESRQTVYINLHSHFVLIGYSKTETVRIEDLTSSIELYNSLIGLNRYDDAWSIFRSRLSDALVEANTVRQGVELLELLFPDGIANSPRLTRSDEQQWLFKILGQYYIYIGKPASASAVIQRSIDLASVANSPAEMCVGYGDLSLTASQTGGMLTLMRNAANVQPLFDDIPKSLKVETIVSCSIGLALQQEIDLAYDTVSRGTASLSKTDRWTYKLVWLAFYPPLLRIHYMQFVIDEVWPPPLDSEDVKSLYDALDTGKLGHFTSYVLILKATKQLLNQDYLSAVEEFAKALSSARTANALQQELQSLVSLAELERRRGNLDIAREHLADTWEACERAPYRLIHTDGLNVLAQIERDAGNTAAAIAAATKAYELAWCDGISADGEHVYAYWWGLQDARKHLEELGAPIPILSPFDPAAHDPLPEIDWDALLKGVAPDSDDFSDDLP